MVSGCWLLISIFPIFISRTKTLMWIYVKWVAVQYLLTFLWKTNISNKAPLTRTSLSSLLFEMHHNTTLNANPLHTVRWSLPCYLLLVACMHFQQSFLTSLLLHLSLIPFNLYAFAYPSLSITSIALFWRGAFPTFCSYFNIFPYSPQHLPVHAFNFGLSITLVTSSYPQMLLSSSPTIFF